MNPNNIAQILVDGMAAQAMRERQESGQMTLGRMIDVLAGMDEKRPVSNLFGAHSYRGYYTDLAFELAPGTRQAGELLAECRSVMGKALTGYKGGEFVMGENTPVWVADYGCCGEKLMAINPDGTISDAPDEYW